METIFPYLDYTPAVIQQSPVLLFFFIHLTVGRTFSVLTGYLLLHLPPLQLIALAWVGDIMNIPFFTTLYAVGHRGLRLSPLIARWFDRTRAYLEHRRFYERFAALGALGVILVAATPMWGCGMWSAILLARTMRMKRLQGTLCLSVGSVAGSVILLVLAGGVRAAFFRW